MIGCAGAPQATGPTPPSRRASTGVGRDRFEGAHRCHQQAWQRAGPAHALLAVSLGANVVVNDSGHQCRHGVLYRAGRLGRRGDQTLREDGAVVSDAFEPLPLTRESY